MAPLIIRLNLSGTTVHVNAHQVLYYYAKHNSDGGIVTEVFFTEKFGIEVTETPLEIDQLIKNYGETSAENLMV